MDEDVREAVINNEIKGYGMFLHPLFLGGYSKELNEYFEEIGFMPRMQDGDFETICQKLDYYGLNFYNGLYDDTKAKTQQAINPEGGGNY